MMWSYAKIVMAAFIVVALVVGADFCCAPDQLSAKGYMDNVYQNDIYIDYNKDVIVENYDGRLGNYKYFFVKPKARKLHIKYMDGKCKEYPYKKVEGSYPRCMPSTSKRYNVLPAWGVAREGYTYKIHQRTVHHVVRARDCLSEYTLSTIDGKKYNTYEFRDVKLTVDNSDVFEKDCS